MSRRNRKRNKQKRTLTLAQLDEQDAYQDWLAGSVHTAHTVKRTSTWTGKACHKGMVRMFEIGSATVYAGKANEALDSSMDWALMVSLAGEWKVPRKVVSASPSMIGVLEEVGLYGVEVPWIAIEWEDFSIPGLRAEDWHRLVEVIGSQVGPVAVYCIGGHGRTGTALAILGSLADAIPLKDDPVEWVRTHYCRDVVESRSQIAYIEHVTGRVVKAKPADSPLVGGWQYSGDGTVYKPAGSTKYIEPPAISATGKPATFTGPGLVEGFDGEQRVLFNAAGDVVWRESQKAAVTKSPN